jgi:hypothetical protein
VKITPAMAIINALVSCFSASGQTAGSQRPDAPQPKSLFEMSRASSWSRIGAPPSQTTPAVRKTEWAHELAIFNKGLDIIRQSWTGKGLDKPEDLSFQVGQYEDVIHTVTESGGYGNLVLADSLRRLSLGLLTRYLITHPTEYNTMNELLSASRVLMLGCPGTSNMITEELKLSPRSGSWHLSENDRELDAILRAAGSTAINEAGRGLLNQVGPSSLISEPDISGLLYRLSADEWLERVLLPCIVEFLRRGGSLDNLDAFDTIMRDQLETLRRPPFGDTVGPANIKALVRSVRKWHGEPIPFAEVVGN